MFKKKICGIMYVFLHSGWFLLVIVCSCGSFPWWAPGLYEAHATLWSSLEQHPLMVVSQPLTLSLLTLTFVYLWFSEDPPDDPSMCPPLLSATVGDSLLAAALCRTHYLPPVLLCLKSLPVTHLIRLLVSALGNLTWNQSLHLPSAPCCLVLRSH